MSAASPLMSSGSRGIAAPCGRGASERRFRPLNPLGTRISLRHFQWANSLALYGWSVHI